MRADALVLLLLSSSAFAQTRVQEVLSSREISLSRESGDICLARDMYAIYPQGDKDPEPSAFAEVTDGANCVLTVRSHPGSPLVRAGDPARRVDFTRGAPDVPGRYDLVREDHREYASRYKPLVYGGLLFGQTAATLDRHEFLVGPLPLMFGLTRNFQLDTSWFRLFEQVGELGAKYQFYSNEDMKLTTRVQGSRFFDRHVGAWAAELMYDSTSNSRSMSHTRLRFSSKLPEQLVGEDEAKQKDYQIELSTVNEWMLKSWHRILFGPKFISGEKNDLGFLFSFIFVFDRFHASANLNVNSVREFNFRGYKQVFGADLFWRF